MSKDGVHSDSARMSMMELCHKANVSRPTVYKYLRLGVLHQGVKEGPTKRKYDETHLKRIEKIQFFRKHKKLSISEIKALLKVDSAKEITAPGQTDDVRQLIFNQTLELFSSKGLTKTKISDITEALNLGKGTFYQYFKNKEELVLECIERTPEIILPEKTWNEIRKERHYFRRLNKRAEMMLDAFPTFVGIISIVKLALKGNDLGMKQKAIDCFKIITRALQKDLGWGVENGIVRDIDQEFIAFLIFGLGEAAGFWIEMNPNYSIQDCTDKLIDFVEKGIGHLEAPDAQDFYADEKKFEADVEDLNDTVFLLKHIRFNGNTKLEARLGDGTVTIGIKNIAHIEKKIEAPENEVRITMRDGENIMVQLDENTLVSGKISYGNYTIPMTKTLRISIRPMC